VLCDLPDELSSTAQALIVFALQALWNQAAAGA
jgi:hypothetical protein